MDGKLPARVVLKGGKAKLFKDGQPLVYSGAIDRVVGRPAPVAGDLVLVADGREQVFAWGVFNPSSMFRVRVMQLEAEAEEHPECCLNLGALLEQRLQAAVELRNSIGLPSQKTNVFRLVNAEGDRLSGLVVDMFGSTAVVASSAAWVEMSQDLIKGCLLALPGVERVVWRSNAGMLKEEGIELQDGPGEEGQEQEGSPAPADHMVEVVEQGIRFVVDPGGQKTGFYADQRENRAALAALCKGKRVLDLCCYSGGFAISAALQGAASVTAVDSSRAALELGRKNAELNGVVSRVEFVKSDIEPFMKEAIKQGQTWDVIVLDPPKLAPTRKSVNRAVKKYQRLNADAMRMIPAEGGLLLTCTCSGAMTQQSGAFANAVKAAAVMARKHIAVLRVAGTGMDHVVSPDYPEGNYLTTMLLRVTT